MPRDTRNKDGIRAFLVEVRKAVYSDRITVANRKEFVDTIAFFGLKLNGVKDILCDLQLGDYYQGPMENRAGADLPLLYTFLYPYMGRKIYIKISVGDHHDGNGNSLFVLSFHIDREELYRH